MILICYDGSADAKEAIARGASLLRGQPATVLTVWQPFDSAARGLSGGTTDMQQSDEANRIRIHGRSGSCSVTQRSQDRCAHHDDHDIPLLGLHDLPFS